MDWEKIKGMGERVILMAMSWAVGAGYVSEAISSEIAAVLVAALGVAIGYYVNTQKVLVKAAASMPDVERVVVSNKLDAADLSEPGASVTH